MWFILKKITIWVCAIFHIATKADVIKKTTTNCTFCYNLSFSVNINTHSIPFLDCEEIFWFIFHLTCLFSGKYQSVCENKSKKIKKQNRKNFQIKSFFLNFKIVKIILVLAGEKPSCTRTRPQNQHQTNWQDQRETSNPSYNEYADLHWTLLLNKNNQISNKKTGASTTFKFTKTKSSRLQAENNRVLCKWPRESFKANRTNHNKKTNPETRVVELQTCRRVAAAIPAASCS